MQQKENKFVKLKKNEGDSAEFNWWVSIPTLDLWEVRKLLIKGENHVVCVLQPNLRSVREDAKVSTI